MGGMNRTDLYLQGEKLCDNLLKDLDIKDYLKGQSVEVDLLNKGVVLITGIKTAEARVGVEEGREKGLTSSVHAEHEYLKTEFGEFRFAAQRALKGRNDLLAKIDIEPRKGRAKGHAEAGAEEPKSGKKGGHPKEEPKGPDGNPAADAAAEDARRGPHLGLALPRFTDKMTKDMGNAQAEPEIVKAMEPYGFGAEVLATLVTRAEALAKSDEALSTAKGVTRGAKADLRKADKVFHLWYVPWRRRLIKKLAPRPDFLTRLGLPVPKEKKRKKAGPPEAAKGDAKAQADAKQGEAQPPNPQK